VVQHHLLVGAAGAAIIPDNAVARRRDLMLLSIRDTGEKSPLAQSIFDDLAIKIVEGHLRPGDTINSVDLARQFGTSRTPVREALVALEAQRLLVIPPRRRPYIADLTWQQASDIYRLRASLFALAAEFILERHASVPLDELCLWQTALEQDARRGDVESYFWHNVGFRLIEIKLSGSEFLQRSLADLGMRTLLFRHSGLSQPERLKSYADDHRRLLMAYRERDLEVAVAMSRTLIMAGLKGLKYSRILDDNADLSDAGGKA
jgi:DNA-binding GntR family transcriptional regulator